MPFSDFAPWNFAKRLGSPKDLLGLQRQVNRLVEELIEGISEPLQEIAGSKGARTRLRADLVRDDDRCIATFEVPGISDGDVEVVFARGTLTVRGEKKPDVTAVEHGERLRGERAFGAFEENLAIPFDIDSSKIEASLKRGVLTIILPRRDVPREEITKISVRAED